MRDILLTLVAPFLYWVLGSPLLLRRDPAVHLLVPLLGGCIAGLVAELAYATGLPPRILIGAALAATLAILLLRRPAHAGRSLLSAYGLYVVALVPAVVSPFPIIGTWDGDWLLLYKAGRTLWEGGIMSSESLQRPPLFGGLASPLWAVQDGLIAYQIAATVMSSAALGACLFAAARFTPAASGWKLLAPLVLSPFFLHHTAACWGKLMTAGLLLAAAAELRHGVSWKAAAWAGVWFAAAVAVHQSSIIYFPLLAVCAITFDERKLAGLWRFTAASAVAGVLLVGSYEAWSIWRFGLEAKVAANPSISARLPGESPLHTALLVSVSSFVGWAPIEALVRWMQQPDRLQPARIQKEAFWLLTSWLQVLAGTFVGVWLPFLLGGARTVWSAIRKLASSPSVGLWLAGGGVTFVANALLNPYSASIGSMQTGLVPLGTATVLGLAAAALQCPPAVRHRILAITAVLGTIPWLILNVGVSAGLVYVPAFRAGFESGSEGDWKRLVAEGLTPLGLTYFPLLQLTVLTIAVVLSLRHLRRARAS